MFLKIFVDGHISKVSSTDKNIIFQKKKPREMLARKSNATFLIRGKDLPQCVSTVLEAN